MFRALLHLTLSVVMLPCLSQASEGATCADKPIDLDGNILTCQAASLALYPEEGLIGACRDLFCNECDYKHACDLACEVCTAESLKVASGQAPPPSPSEHYDWWTCEPGQLMDCTGVCRSAEHCRLHTAGYDSCRHWIGDGHCDDGCGATGDCGRLSDLRFTMAFNCPLYECDGGDCEVCGENPLVISPTRSNENLAASVPWHLVLGVTSDTGIPEDPRSLQQSSHLLWPGPKWHSPELSGFRFPLDAHSAITAAAEPTSSSSGNKAQQLHFFPQCRNAALFDGSSGDQVYCEKLLQQTRSETTVHGNKNSVISDTFIGADTNDKKGGLSCSQSFCDECGTTAGACDKSCGFCSSWQEMPWVVLPKPNVSIFMTLPPRSPNLGKGDNLYPSTGVALGPRNKDAAFDGSEGVGGYGNLIHSRQQRQYKSIEDKNAMSWLIVVTAAISPLQGVTHTQRLSPLLRTRDYVKAIRRWAGEPSDDELQCLAQAQRKEQERGEGEQRYRTQGGERDQRGWENSTMSTSNSNSTRILPENVLLWLFQKCENPSMSLFLPTPPLWPLVVVESSGANLTALRHAVKQGHAAREDFVAAAAALASEAPDRSRARAAASVDSLSGKEEAFAGKAADAARLWASATRRPFYFVSFRLRRSEVGDQSLGKGIAERLSILRALESVPCSSPPSSSNAPPSPPPPAITTVDVSANGISCDENDNGKHCGADTPDSFVDFDREERAAGDGSGANGGTYSELDGEDADEQVPLLTLGEVLTRSTHAVKVTGRYYVRNLDQELQRLALDAMADEKSKDTESDSSITNQLAGSLGHVFGNDSPRRTHEGDMLSLATPAAQQLISKGWPLVVCQSTPSPWSLWDGVVRSEVVGFALVGDSDDNCNSNTRNDSSSSAKESAKKSAFAAWLFQGQDESQGRPMERVLFERARALNSSRASYTFPVRVFGPLFIDPTRNAENDLAQLL